MGDTIILLAWAGAIAWPMALGYALWRGLKKGRGPGIAGWLFILVITAIWGLGIRAFLWEPETLVVRRVDVESRQWTGAPLRIGIISDIHMGAPHMSVSRLNGIIAQMNSERPDIIVLLGDFAGRSEPASLRSASGQSLVMSGLPPLAQLKAPLGTWAILGNHDWWYDGDAIEKGLKAAGIPVLENQRVRIGREGGAFWLAGLADYDSMRTKPSYSDTLADLPEGEPVLALSH